MKTNELYCPKCCSKNLVYMNEKNVVDDFGKSVLNVYYQCEDCHHEWIEIEDAD